MIDLIESVRKCRCLSFDFILLACFGHEDDENRLINVTDDHRSRATFKLFKRHLRVRCEKNTLSGPSIKCSFLER